jgi:hypothetical protein
MAAWAFLITASASNAAFSQQVPPVERAFEHYERIRVALAQDTTENVSVEAKALSPLAREIAGEEAERAAASLAQAKTLENAREQFGALSEALVPKFVEARLPGVQGYVCSMKQRRWAQRGTTAANPYFGKAMATCGTPIKDPETR